MLTKCCKKFFCSAFQQTFNPSYIVRDFRAVKIAKLCCHWLKYLKKDKNFVLLSCPGCRCWQELQMETKWSLPYYRKVDRLSRLCGSLFQLFRVFCKTKLMMKSHSRLKKTRSGTQKKTRNNYHVIR